MRIKLSWEQCEQHRVRNAAKVFLAKLLAEVHPHIPVPAQRVGNRLSGQIFPGGLVKVEASREQMV